MPIQAHRQWVLIHQYRQCERKCGQELELAHLRVRNLQHPRLVSQPAQKCWTPCAAKRLPALFCFTTAMPFSASQCCWLTRCEVLFHISHAQGACLVTCPLRQAPNRFGDMRTAIQCQTVGALTMAQRLKSQQGQRNKTARSGGFPALRFFPIAIFFQLMDLICQGELEEGKCVAPERWQNHRFRTLKQNRFGTPENVLIASERWKWSHVPRAAPRHPPPPPHPPPQNQMNLHIWV